ncbi:MAG TPA: quinolinate synthase NadA [Deltaproteobacteria bacterium]|nr:quinolinate synthase NadA [Deltaproteobacteria bacterium]
MNIVNDIMKLKRARDAVILAHNYQRPEIQDIADFVGDSLGLSIQASGTDAEVIVFCGVHFMAETAKILSPRKTVLLPDMDAGCPMADMITADQLRELKTHHPDATVVCYVNTTAEVKAESDICCTSANAVSIVTDLKKANREILFVPDMYLGDFVAREADCDLITWRGFCPSHARVLPDDILIQQGLHPRARVLAHPECTPEVRKLADRVMSTEGMCWLVHEMKEDEFIVATEVGILHRMGKENPGKKFYPASELAVCPNMKRITLEKLHWALEGMHNEITVSRETIARAKKSIQRMLVYRS